MVEFWSSVLLCTHEFKANVFGTHMALSGVVPRHFERWLPLFEQSSRRQFAPGLAEEFMVVARRIAASLQYGYFGKLVVQ